MIHIAKLIMFSSFIKNQGHAQNLVQYISTREGVEFNSTGLKGEVSDKQKELINEVVKSFPFLNQIEQYENYVKDNSSQKASEFLSEAFELIDDQLVSKEIYLKYISERPRVEKLNTHGLFNSEGESDLSKEIENIKNHNGVVWTHIISLKREDAQRLGYDNLKQWQLLLKTKIPEIAQNMNINIKNLVWNAAFHNEGYHPHVHLVMYSKNNKEGYLKQPGIEKIKSVLMNEIFKEELLEIKQEKTLKREEIADEFSKELDGAYQNIVTKNFKVSDKLINEFIELSKMLPGKGKLDYGYQDKKVKEQVNKIVEAILENDNLKKLYSEYSKYKKDLAAYYSSKKVPEKDITKDKEFRKLQNLVMKAANKVSENIVNDIEHKGGIKPEEAAAEEISAGKGIDINTAEEKSYIYDRLKQLDNEMDAIESKRSKEKQEANVFNLPDNKAIKQKNIEEEEKEILEIKQKSLSSMEGKYLNLLDKYSSGDENFISKLNSIYCLKNDSFSTFDEENSVIQSETIESAKLILNDPEIKDDYEKYIKAFNEKALIDKSSNFNEHKDLKHFASEILTTINLNRIIKEKELLELRGKSLSNMEDKFLKLLDKYNSEDDNFKEELSKITDLKNEKLLSLEEEKGNIQDEAIKSAKIILNDPEVKENYDNYIKACEEYSTFIGENEKFSKFKALSPFGNEILSTVNVNKIIEGNTGHQREVENRVLTGAKKLKDDYALNPKLDVSYNDYSKSSRDEIKYFIKNVVFDIADLLYFSAKEDETQKNKLSRLNNKLHHINREKQRNSNTIGY